MWGLNQNCLNILELEKHLAVIMFKQHWCTGLSLHSVSIFTKTTFHSYCLKPLSVSLAGFWDAKISDVFAKSFLACSLLPVAIRHRACLPSFECAFCLQAQQQRDLGWQNIVKQCQKIHNKTSPIKLCDNREESCDYQTRVKQSVWHGTCTRVQYYFHRNKWKVATNLKFCENFIIQMKLVFQTASVFRLLHVILMEAEKSVSDCRKYLRTIVEKNLWFAC